MEFGDYRIDFRLTSYWLVVFLAFILAVFGANSYFGNPELELDVVQEVDRGQQVTIESSYSEGKPDIFVDGDAVGEGTVTYIFNESGNYTVAAQISGNRVERTVEVMEDRNNFGSVDNPDQEEDQEPSQNQNNSEDNTGEDDAQQDGDQTEEISSRNNNDRPQGFVFDGELSQGEQITVTLYDDGDAVTGEELIIDGESQGETDSNGEIQVTLPYSRSAVFSTSYPGVEDELRPLKESDIDIEPTLKSPSDGEDFSIPWDSTKEVSFEFEMEDQAYWEIYLNNGVEASGTGSSISETVELEPGSYDWKVRAEKASEVLESDTRSFEVVGEPELVLLDEDSYSDVNEVNLEFSIYGDMDHYNVYVNDQLEQEKSSNSMVNVFNKEFRADYGEKNVKVEVINNGDTKTSKSRSFTVLEPVAFIDGMEYVFESGNHKLDMNVDVKEQADYTVNVSNQDGSGPGQVASGSLNTGIQEFDVDLGGLNSDGLYQTKLALESKESEKTASNAIMVDSE